MRVTVDGRPLQKGYKAHRERGIGRYAFNLLSAMLELDEAPELELAVQANLPELDLIPGPQRIAAPYAPAWLPKGKRLLSHHWLIRRAFQPAWREGRVVHFLAHLDAPCWIGPRTVLTVHDLIAQRMEALYRGRRSSLRFRAERWLETRALYQAARIIVPSRQTRDDLVELYGIDPGRMVTIPEAADPRLGPVEDPARRAAVLARHGLDDVESFFLYVGGIDQRKDLTTLLAALGRLREQGLAPTLALAGSIKSDKQYPALQAALAEPGLAGSVRELGYVPDDDLPALYSACAAFVFPSLYEGFGLPPLEAMACGAPVVAVRASAVPEVVGDAGILVEPGRAEALAAALARVLEEPGLAEDLRERGRARAREFSWAAAARETCAVYKEVAGAA